MTKLLICGGRDFDDVDFAVDVLDRVQVFIEDPISEVITGEAKGADEIGMEWANVMELPHRGFPVSDSDWKRHGKMAGMNRNKAMLDYEPDLVVAFPGGNGTQNMVDIASEVPWIEVIHCQRRLFNSKLENGYQFLSNFAEGYDFADEDGLWWKTSEHYYQAQKSADPHEQFTIQDAPTAARARDLGNKARTKRMNWDRDKLDVMRKATSLKFAKGTLAATRLLDTGFDYLVHYAPWGDPFWGVVDSPNGYTGQNWQGRILNEWKFEL